MRVWCGVNVKVVVCLFLRSNERWLIVAGVNFSFAMHAEQHGLQLMVAVRDHPNSGLPTHGGFQRPI